MEVKKKTYTHIKTEQLLTTYGKRTPFYIRCENEKRIENDARAKTEHCMKMPC